MSTDSHDGGERLAPVIPLFGAATTAEPTWRSTWDEDVESSSPDASSSAAARVDDDGRSVDAAAVEHLVLKKLRARPLSDAEVRAVIRGHSLDEQSADALLRGLRRHGYVDDAALAEQLVRAAVERKGQGRQVIAQTLAKRGIPKDVADAALGALPDDDLERALDFARGKARSMGRLDHDTALRRLVGQLSRRGYPSPVAVSAARQALEDPGDRS
ncbi:MAG: regulatory protein RecX [Microbacterium sp.]|nr:regulatory protein RecX [Microbacterium sp.]